MANINNINTESTWLDVETVTKFKNKAEGEFGFHLTKTDMNTRWKRSRAEKHIKLNSTL